MQIIIPMSGIGKRFLEAGYQEPKPLIQVEGKPIIQHVVERFPTETNFTFICNEEHLQKTSMHGVLSGIAPKGRILSIPPHKKGPVWAVAEIEKYIDGDEPTIVNYCDFSWRWDYSDFKKTVKENQCDGCVVSYKGFHPHMLHPNLYASMRDDGKNWMLEIREKHSFTSNKMDCYQSSGTYYFKSGNIVKKYFRSLMDNKVELNGEYYVSLVYNELKKDGLNVFIYEIPFMLQWGTPEDLKEYLYWSEYFLSSREPN
ncbi:MAG: glycosyltransferase family 2 protein [Leptospiraceae bacterium]|nr:glycosyltransferase family 2 protein [Leptospiraceae bacterium]